MKAEPKQRRISGQKAEHVFHPGLSVLVLLVLLASAPFLRKKPSASLQFFWRRRAESTHIQGSLANETWQKVNALELGRVHQASIIFPRCKYPAQIISAKDPTRPSMDSFQKHRESGENRGTSYFKMIIYRGLFLFIALIPTCMFCEG